MPSSLHFFNSNKCLTKQIVRTILTYIFLLYMLKVSPLASSDIPFRLLRLFPFGFHHGLTPTILLYWSMIYSEILGPRHLTNPVEL